MSQTIKKTRKQNKKDCLSSQDCTVTLGWDRMTVSPGTPPAQWLNMQGKLERLEANVVCF